MWPTLASLLEERLADDPKATHVVVHALNEWMHEHWTFNYEAGSSRRRSSRSRS